MRPRYGRRRYPFKEGAPRSAPPSGGTMGGARRAAAGSVPSELQRARRNRRDVATHVDAVAAVLTANVNVQDATPAHLDALLTDEAAAGRRRGELVAHHKCGERAGRTSRRGILGYTVVPNIRE